MMPIHQDPVTPIAIIGIGGRFPGNASDPERLWEILLNGESTLSETPKDRFNVDSFYHPNAERTGTQNFRGGHFMNRSIDAFDAPFFSIMPNEAKAIDPQQRMCLEVAYEAMENAGITLDQVTGTNTSCFVGSFTDDYQKLLGQDSLDFPFYNATGTGTAAMANRISWFYNMVGPSVTLNTACSSSLVALHLGCQSLRTGESDMSLVGGVNVMCSPETNSLMSSLHFISPDSKSQTFDEKANGYGRGEGSSFLVLKPLEKAVRDGDVVRAVIRNTGSNQDGNTPGLTLPSRTSQKNLVQRTYENAGLRLADTAYFEAHGTGTVAGDSTETQVLGETFGRERPTGQPLFVGSVKANIGHLEGASGVAGVVKAIHVLEQGRIPPQIWFEKLNPRIRLQEWNLAVPTQALDWPYPGPRRASVNSFGFAGANAHAILEDANSYFASHGINGLHNTKATEGLLPSPFRSALDSSTSESSDSGYETKSPTGKEEVTTVESPKLIVWSAHDQAGLKRVFDSWKTYLGRKSANIGPEAKSTLLEDLAYTAATSRTRFPWKTFTVCSKPEDMIEGDSNMARPIRSSQRPKLAFIFTGQGAQHYSMGRSLMSYEIYSTSIKDADAHLQSLGCPWSVQKELFRDESSSRVGDAEFSQPLCTIVQVALVDLLHSLDIVPVAVAGHSSGEIAAAYAKGAITREAAWLIAYQRGRLSGSLSLIKPGIDGTMLATGISEKEASGYIEKVTTGQVVVACVNSPTSVTLSGDRSAILEIERLVQNDGHMTRLLRVSKAYHSPHMRIVGGLYQELLGDIQPLPHAHDGVKMFSSVTGEEIDNSDLGTQYWVSNLLGQVKFSAAVQALASHSTRRATANRPKYCYVNAMVEVGPHGALQGPIKQTVAAADAECETLSVQDRKKDARHAFLEAVGVLFQHNYDLNAAVANQEAPAWRSLGQRKRLVDMPPFPWNHSNRYWHESTLSTGFRFRKHPRKDLLGARDNDNNDHQPRWRNYLRLSENPWIEDHMVQGRILYPAAGMLAMVLEAAKETADQGKVIEGYELREVRIHNALMIPRTGDAPETMIQLGPSSQGSGSSAWQGFNIYSRIKDSPWAQNCSGFVQVHYTNINRTSEQSIFMDENVAINKSHQAKYKRATQACTENLPPQQFYGKQEKLGLHLGESFRNVTEFHRNHGGQLVCTVQISDIASLMPANFTHDHVIHPCTLDSFIHSSLAIISEGLTGNGLSLPVSVERFFIYNDIPSEPGAMLRSHSAAKPHGLRNAQIDLYAFTKDMQKPLISLEQLTVTRLGGETGPSNNEETLGGSERMIASRMDWQEDVSYLDGPGLTTVCNLSVTTNQGKSPLSRLLQLLGHKYPDLTVMETDPGEGHITEQLLDSLRPVDGEQTPWYKLYTAAEPNEDAAKALSTKFKTWGAHFNSVLFSLEEGTLEEHKPEHGLQAQLYDCVIMRHPTKPDATDRKICNARALLKDHGTLIILNENYSTDTQAEWTSTLHEHNFTGVNCAITTDPANQPWFVPFIVSTARAEPSRKFPGDILIVTPAAEKRKSPWPHQLPKSLTEELEKTRGLTPSYATLLETQDIDLKNKCCIVLAELESPVLFDISPNLFLAVKRLLLEAQSVFWVTAGSVSGANPKSSLITGLLRSVRQEQPEVSLTHVDLEWDPSDYSDDCGGTRAGAIISLLDGWCREDADHEFAVQSGRLLIPRLRLDRRLNDFMSTARDGPKKELAPFKQPDRALTIAIASPGMFDSIYFKDDPTYNDPLADDDVEIEIKASGLNFMDVMVALGQVPEPTIGVECSGIVRRVGSQVTAHKPGDRVLTNKLGCFSNFIRNPECLVHAIPVGMTFETAASIPINYSTAYQALVETARLRPGESILIHGAAGGVGQAAIMMAMNIGAEVYVTVGSQKKKTHLLNTYAVPADHIFNSRDLSFAPGINRMTGGRGVDVVLNSLSGEALRQSWLLVAPYGRFIELGKRDIVENSSLDMAPFIKNVSFHAVNILVSYRECVPRAAYTLHNSLRFFWDHHCQPPSPIQVMPFSQLPDALRLLRSGTQVGKVVIRAEDEDKVMAVPRPVTPVQLSPEATYVIVGGMGGLGQFIAKWMVEHGARHLLFLSRQGAKHPDAAGVLETLNASNGVQAAAYECDITDSEQVQRAFSRCRDEKPPIRGLLQAAMLLSDATFTHMTHSQWTTSIRTKALGTWNLHLHTTAQPLDFFIMLSSVSGIIGWRGQANYAASNTFLDALAHHRRARGLPAASVDVGAVLDVGYIAGRTELRNAVKLQGLLGIGGAELLSILHAAIMGQGQERNTTNTTDSDGIQFISGIATGGWAVSENIEPPYYHSDAKMSHFRLIGAAHPGAAGTQAPKLQLQGKLSTARSLEEASTAVSDALRGRLAQQLSISVEDIDASKPVSAYGVDSLTAVEIRAWSFRDVQADVSVLDVVNTGSIWGLVGIIVRNSRLTPVEILES